MSLVMFALVLLAPVVCAQAPAGAQASPEADRSPVARAIAAADGTGDYFVPVYASLSDPARPFFVQRVGSDGKPLWGPRGAWVADSVVHRLLLADGQGGVFVAWSAPMLVDGRRRLRLQHLDATGAPAWGRDGLEVAPAEWSMYPQSLLSDGGGGVLVCWQGHVTGGYSETRLARLDATGAPLWPAPVSVAPGMAAEHVLSDGAGGAILLGRDYGMEYGPLRIWARRIDPAGAQAWGDDGVTAATTPFMGSYLDAVEDGGGGAILGWVDGTEDGLYLRAQRLGRDGAALWDPSGVVVPGYSLTSSWFAGVTRVSAVSDGRGGVVFAQELASESAEADPHDRLLLQRLDPAGNVLWPAGGLRLQDSVASTPATLCANGTGGVDIVWRSLEGPRWVIRAQRIEAYGRTAWGPRGTLVSAAPDADGLLASGPDCAGGLLLTWEDRRAIEWRAQTYRVDAYAQRVSPAGAPLWTPGGRCVAFADPGSMRPSVAPSGDGVIATWLERDGFDMKAFARAYEAGGSARSPVLRLGAAAGSQRALVAVPDGEGGVYVAWEQSWAEAVDLRVQHVTADMRLAWGPEGTLVRGVQGTCVDPAIVADLSGGAYVAWVEDGAAVRVLRLDASGVARWDPAGLIVSGANGSLRTPALVLDGVDGVLVAWIEDALGRSQTQVQRVDGSGRAAWSAGGLTSWPLYPDWNQHLRPRVAPDGAGGAYVMATSSDVQHLGADGVALWPGTGTTLGATSARNRTADLTLDPDGDVRATWLEERDGNGILSLFTRRIRPTGEPRWSMSSGFLASGLPEFVDTYAFPDPGGAALVLWAGATPVAGPANAGPSAGAQRVTANGTAYWPWSPTVLRESPVVVARSSACSDSAAGAYAAWEEVRPDGTHRVRLQHLFADGTIAWGPIGLAPDLAALARATASARRARLTWHLGDDAVVLRAERRTVDGPWTPCGAVSVGDSGLVTLDDATEPGTRYAYRLVVMSDGVETSSEITWIETPPLAGTLFGIRPSPARGPFTVSFALAEGVPARLEVFDIGGRRVDERALDGLAPGRHTLTLGDTRPLRPGLYLVSLVQGGHRETRRVAVLR